VIAQTVNDGKMLFCLSIVFMHFFRLQLLIQTPYFCTVLPNIVSIKGLKLSALLGQQNVGVIGS